VSEAVQLVEVVHSSETSMKSGNTRCHIREDRSVRSDGGSILAESSYTLQLPEAPERGASRHFTFSFLLFAVIGEPCLHMFEIQVCTSALLCNISRVEFGYQQKYSQGVT
jgi:hypothetical protein